MGQGIILVGVCSCLALGARADLRIGFIDPTARPGLEDDEGVAPRNAAALAFARTRGIVTRLHPDGAGGWRGTDGRMYAPEEFDVLWFHQGDDPGAAVVGRANAADLLAYIEGGGAVLLSGAAGRVLNETGLEPTPLRVLGVSDWAYVSGFVAREQHRQHPAFAGFDTGRPVLLTSFGGNALADFYGTAGPHGELLADGNAGVGERPVVEYRVGDGHVIFVGWRLPDFTTATDAHRPNLERFFTNLLQYLSDRNTNRGQMARPGGRARYTRLLGVPFLRAETPEALQVAGGGQRTQVVLASQATPGSLEADGAFISEEPVTGETARAQALALTVLSRDRPAGRYLERRWAEQAEDEQRERELTAGLRVIKPQVELIAGPLKPLRPVEPAQSVLLGRSPFMAPGDGKGDITPVYEPLEDGGFRIAGSTRRLNRPIVHGQNRVWTGDVPIFRMDTTTGNGCYSADRAFPLWPRPDAAAGNVYPCMGTLRLGVPGPDGALVWLDDLKTTTAAFRPGYTEYEVREPDGAWTAAITVAPALDCHGMVCRVEFDREAALTWQYGGVWWSEGEANANRVEVVENLGRTEAHITEPNLPDGEVVAACDVGGRLQVIETGRSKQVRFTPAAPQRVYHIVATWGVTRHDEERVQSTMARLNTAAAADWPAARDELKRRWFDAYIAPALDPTSNLRRLMVAPGEALQATRDWWDRRRAEFQIRTPDPQLNALINWNRCISEYHRQGPGLVLGVQYWVMYSHISTGWYGKQWGGDHEAVADCLRLYGAMQAADGFVNWVSPSLVAFAAENNTPYWVDQVWWHYAWTGDQRFVRDLWPLVRKAVDWQRRHNDPDGDGLFRDWYEYWNCDSNGKGPKAAAPSAMSWAMLDRAARLAAVVGDADAESAYRALADKTRDAVLRELWREDAGRLGSIGADGIWRGHPQTWEEYLAINAGLLSAEQGRRAMRWLESHYGFEPQPGVKLLACSDWFPIRWSCQWVPTGDTCLAVLAGMKCGDADLWWPYLKTVVGSAFKSDFPGINMGISNAGAGGGDREDVDSDDPHTHVAVRGLFGIEPAIPEGRLDICPAFPSNWQEASITTPDVSYDYRREGDRATFRIRTPKPVVKRVRANLSGEEVTTPAETESVVTVKLGPVVAPPEPPAQPPILAEQQPPTEADTGPPLDPADRGRQVLFDLSAARNVTVEELLRLPFTYDYQDSPSTIVGWWGNPDMTIPPSPRAVQTRTGVAFLTAGRPRPGLGEPVKDLLALSSWPPHPLPAAARISVGLRCERVWLLLQSYVHPMKNYVVNGEVVLRYADGTESIVSLIPPYNLDCYFQHFSRQGVPVPLGVIDWAAGWSFVHQGLSEPHADALGIACEPTKLLESLGLRATCSEGVLGLVGMTALVGALP